METHMETRRTQHRILLIIGGGIAAYKVCEVIRGLRQMDHEVIPVLTSSGSQFVTPLTLASLSGHKVYQDLFSLTDESEIGHIRLSRIADLVLVAPATADLMAKMALGLADDLASTLLLASDRPIAIAPAMNPVMWNHPATQANLATLQQRGVRVWGPEAGDMACGENGLGRLSDPEAILQEITSLFRSENLLPKATLAGRHALVTAGPTHEPIDPVRYIANRSSGRQGYAIADALSKAGACVTLVSGPCTLSAPPGVKIEHVQTATEMHKAVMTALPADIAVMTAAVGDWRPQTPESAKIKKAGNKAAPTLQLTENPDILADLCQHKTRPALVIGFAAESEQALTHAAAKYQAKGCDWLLVNDIGARPEIFGGPQNQVTLITPEGQDPWPLMLKSDVAQQLSNKISAYFSNTPD